MSERKTTGRAFDTWEAAHEYCKEMDGSKEWAAIPYGPPWFVRLIPKGKGMEKGKHTGREHEAIETAKSLLFYVESYGGEVTAGIEAAFPQYREGIEAGRRLLAERDALLIGRDVSDAHILEIAAERDALLEAARGFAFVSCERRGNIHCTMLPEDSGERMCHPCELRASIANCETNKP